MSASRDYDIHLDAKYGALRLIDVPAEIHRTRAPVRTAILMVEPRDVMPTGDEF